MNISCGHLQNNHNKTEPQIEGITYYSFLLFCFIFFYNFLTATLFRLEFPFKTVKQFNTFVHDVSESLTMSWECVTNNSFSDLANYRDKRLLLFCPSPPLPSTSPASCSQKQNKKCVALFARNVTFSAYGSVNFNDHFQYTAMYLLSEETIIGSH